MFKKKQTQTNKKNLIKDCTKSKNCLELLCSTPFIQNTQDRKAAIHRTKG